MLFNSLPFLLLFMPLAWGGHRLCALLGQRAATGWLVAMSLLFYAWWNPACLFLLCGSIVFNFTVGMGINKSAPRPRTQELVLALGIAANLLLLCYYKYLFPLLHWLDGLGFQTVDPATSVILPLGISFFTFTQIGYLVDCKAGIAAGGRFLDYCLFVTFFPHLIAGPILHHREMMPQFKDRATLRFDTQNIALGLSIFFIGLAKKDLVADKFAVAANQGFENAARLGVADAWNAVLSYSVQIYYDFSGYSEMALGLALLFNIRFPANFDSPYKAPSVIEFWQRWHMTLTRYLNLYLYNPVALWITRRRAGRGLPVGRAPLKTGRGLLMMVVAPTFITMFLAGVWHGAGLTYIIFGLLHAVYLSINHWWRLKFHQKKTAPEPGRLERWFGTVWQAGLTYLAVLVAQIFFRAASVRDALDILACMAGCHPQPLPDQPLGIRTTKLLILAYLAIWLTPNVLQIFDRFRPALTKPHAPAPSWQQWRPNAAWAVATGLLAVAALLAVSGQSEFLYFQF